MISIFLKINVLKNYFPKCTYETNVEKKLLFIKTHILCIYSQFKQKKRVNLIHTI